MVSWPRLAKQSLLKLDVCTVRESSQVCPSVVSSKEHTRIELLEPWHNWTNLETEVKQRQVELRNEVRQGSYYIIWTVDPAGLDATSILDFSSYISQLISPFFFHYTVVLATFWLLWPNTRSNIREEGFYFGLQFNESQFIMAGEEQLQVHEVTGLMGAVVRKLGQKVIKKWDRTM